MSFIREFCKYIGVRKKYWMLPVMLIMVFLGWLLFFAQGSALAPFIYTLF
jgi:hypothetical protein